MKTICFSVLLPLQTKFHLPSGLELNTSCHLDTAEWNTCRLILQPGLKSHHRKVYNILSLLKLSFMLFTTIYRHLSVKLKLSAWLDTTRDWRKSLLLDFGRSDSSDRREGSRKQSKTEIQTIKKNNILINGKRPEWIRCGCPTERGVGWAKREECRHRGRQVKSERNTTGSTGQIGHLDLRADSLTCSKTGEHGANSLSRAPSWDVQHIALA